MDAIIFIAVYARSAWARGQKHLQKRRATGFSGSDHNFAAKRSAAPAGRAEGAGNLCSDPENARSRIFHTVHAEPVEAFSPFVLRYRRIGLSHVKAFCSNQAPGSLMSSGAALSPQQAIYCSFASPKKVGKRKGDPGVCGGPAGVELALASLRQSLALIRLDLRSSAHSQGFGSPEFGKRRQTN